MTIMLHTLTFSTNVRRFQAQQDAVNLLAGAKTQANPESTVGSHVQLAQGARYACLCVNPERFRSGKQHGLTLVL
jgi:hypothetical protein